MKIEKKYFSISEVSKMLDIKEHVIRHWDSIDPKTNKIRIENLSIRTNGGTRFFNKSHIKKLTSIRNLLKENGKRNYSLDLASKIISQNKNKSSYDDTIEASKKNFNSSDIDIKFDKIKKITNNLKKLLKSK
ncbi:MerR family transcriptional regulator [bacterium]|nr:MerR family transcriptional regulator [bacterium]